MFFCSAKKNIPFTVCAMAVSNKIPPSTVLSIAAIVFLAAAETVLFHSFARERTPRFMPQAGLEVGQARKYIALRKDLYIVDVRTRMEFAGEHLQDAVNIPLRTLKQRAGEFPSGRPVLLYCGFGGRSFQAYKILRGLRPDIKEISFVRGEIIMHPYF